MTLHCLLARTSQIHLRNITSALFKRNTNSHTKRKAVIWPDTECD